MVKPGAQNRKGGLSGVFGSELYRYCITRSPSGHVFELASNTLLSLWHIDLEDFSTREGFLANWPLAFVFISTLEAVRTITCFSLVVHVV